MFDRKLLFLDFEIFLDNNFESRLCYLKNTELIIIDIVFHNHSRIIEKTNF